MSRFDEKPNAPASPLNSFFSSDRYVGQGLATYGGLDHTILDQHATIEDVDGDVDAVAEVASDEDTLFAVGRSHWGVDNPNLADEVATSSPVMDRVSTSQTAMDAVSTSATGMEAVAASQTAMDAVVAATDVALPTVVETVTAMNEVSLSDLALDTLWASTAAWDLIKTNAMSVGKFAAGRAGLSGYDYADIDAVAGSQTAMDAVSTSQTAMDAVSTSQTAMDAVSTSSTAMDAVAGSQTAMDAVAASTMAYSATFESDYSISSLWAGTPGAKTILETSGDKVLPYSTSTPGGDANITVDDGSASSLPGSTAHQLYIDINGADDGNLVEITYQVDLSASATLELKTKAEGDTDDSRFKHGVKIDGSEVFETGGLNGYTTRSLDVSSYGGTHDVTFYHENTGYNNTGVDHEFYFADLNLM